MNDSKLDKRKHVLSPNIELKLKEKYLRHSARTVMFVIKMDGMLVIQLRSKAHYNKMEKKYTKTLRKFCCVFVFWQVIVRNGNQLKFIHFYKKT